MGQHSIRAGWMIALGFVLFAPLVLRALTPERNGLALEIVDVTGLLAVSMLAAVLVISARVKAVTRAFGYEAVQGMHRFLGLLSVGLIAAHVVAVLLVNPANIALLEPTVAPPRAVAGTAGLIAAVALAGHASMSRLRGYDRWRWAHILLAIAVAAATVTHVILLQHMVVDPFVGPVLGGIAGFVAVVLLARWFVNPFARRGAFVIEHIRSESATVTTIVLRPRRWGAAPVAFAPGQFVWLRLRRRPSQEHPFTISSASQDGTRPTITYRRSGDWTMGQLAELRLGDQVWIDGPHGGMTPSESGAGLMLIAGGVGITPMMSILRTLHRRHDQRPIRLLLADRPSETLFREELAELARTLSMTITETRDTRVTAELIAPILPDGVVRNHFDYLVCGSPILIGDTTASLAELGIPRKRVHSELFDVR